MEMVDAVFLHCLPSAGIIGVLGHEEERYLFTKEYFFSKNPLSYESKLSNWAKVFNLQNQGK